MNTQEISGNLCQNMVLFHRKSQLSYEDFAAALGVSKSLLQRLESGHGNVTLNTLCVIAEALRLHPALLLTDLPQRLEAPVCSAVLSMLLLYWVLPEPEQRTFLGLLQAMGRPSDGWL